MAEHPNKMVFIDFIHLKPGNSFIMAGKSGLKCKQLISLHWTKYDFRSRQWTLLVFYFCFCFIILVYIFCGQNGWKLWNSSPLCSCLYNRSVCPGLHSRGWLRVYVHTQHPVCLIVGSLYKHLNSYWP